MTPDLHARAARIKMILMDVDGVLTDGRYYHVPGPDGTLAETKGFDAQDGIALQWCHLLGIKTGLISGRVSAATSERARQAKMAYNYQGNTEKIPLLEEILKDSQIAKDDIAYIGDDLTDVVIMHRVGLAIATANARPEVKREAHYTTEVPGGRGAVREAIELILRARGEWEHILAKYELAPPEVKPATELDKMQQG